MAILGRLAPVRWTASTIVGVMRRFVIPGLIVVAAVALLALLTYGVSNHTDTSSIDARVAAKHFPVPRDYTAQLPVLGSSRTESLASFKGKVVLLNVYASWCPPCQSEAPMLGEGAEGTGQARRDDRRCDLSRRDARDRKVRHALRDHLSRAAGSNSDFVHSLGTFRVPETFVINREGRSRRCIAARSPRDGSTRR